MNQPSPARRPAGMAMSGVLALGLAACSSGDGDSDSGASSAASASGSQPASTQSGQSSSTTSRATSAPKETDPQKVLQTSEKSVKGSETVVLTLVSTDDGSGSDDESYRATSRGRVDGTNQKTTFRFKTRGTFEVRIVDGMYYIKGDKTYWDGQRNLPAAEKGKLPNKWLTVPKQHEKRFAGQGIDRLLGSLQRSLSPATATTSNTTMSSTTQAGKPAYKLVRQDDDNPGEKDEEVTLLVDGESKHLPLKATEDDATMSFAGWDNVDSVTKPTGATAPFPKIPDDD